MQQQESKLSYSNLIHEAYKLNDYQLKKVLGFWSKARYSNPSQSKELNGRVVILFAVL